jgi:molybdopterin converting factor small subunit
VATRDDAIRHLEQYAALTKAEATKVIDAVLAAAVQSAVDALVDEVPAPSSAADARAAYVVAVCRQLGRLLRPVEVEVLLRIPRSSASTLINRVRAAYPRLVEAWTQQLISERAEQAEDISTEDRPDHWRVVFGDSAVIDYAYDLLRRRGMTRGVTRRLGEQALEFPATVRDHYGKDVRVLEVLGIAR